MVDLGDGYVQQTVEVNGSRLTVATQDAALRKRILDSATGGEACFSEVDVADPVFPRVVPGDLARAQTLTAYVYSTDVAPGDARAGLVYAVPWDRGVLRAYLSALDAAGPRDQCPTGDVLEGE